MTTRVAVVGLGWAGREIWLPRIVAHPELVVEAVVDPDTAARQAARDAFGAPLVVAGLAELGPGAVDLVVVATPNDSHAALSREALGLGADVFVEKPVCLSQEELTSIEGAARASRTRVMAGSAARHRADVRRLAALVPSLGTIRHVDLSWVRANGVPGRGGWFTDHRRAGGGASMDLGWHLLDVLTHLVGPVHVRDVLGDFSADHVRSAGAGASWRLDAGTATSQALDVEDTARCLLLTDGPSAAVHVAWASHAALDETRIVVEGSDGRAELRCTFGFSPRRDPAARSLTVERLGDSTPVELPPDVLGAEYDTQLDAVVAETTQDPAAVSARTVQHARAALEVIDRWRPSASRRPQAQPAGSPA